MNNIFYVMYIGLLSLVTVLVLVIYFKKKKEINTFSSYYNSDGAFAGFIQKKKNLFRACEFSSNGAILSCSKWFDDNLLKQGQNQGLSQEDI